MATSLKKEVEKKILELLVGKLSTYPTPQEESEKAWIALYTTTPNREAAGTECSYTGYTRKEVAWAAWTFHAGTSGAAAKLENTAEVKFAECSGGEQEIEGVAIVTKSGTSGGEQLVYESLATKVKVSTTYTPVSFAAGELVFTIN